MSNSPNTNSSSGMIESAFRELMKGVYTCVPGYVISLIDSGSKQRAQIQVGIERVDVNGASFALKPIIDVPVHFPGGDYCIEYEINKGCEGLIMFSQRCTDGWKNTGGIAQNPIGRMHDLQDAFFIPGFRSDGNVLADLQNNGIRLRNKSGSQYAWLKNDDSIEIENGLGHIRMAADGTVTINNVVITPEGLITTPENIVWGSGSISGEDHVHSGVDPGAGNSGPPV
ncbi:MULTISPECIES: Gp138 family membrane-puncturing spike protein [unclassified Methylophaga]|jgi:hypothetical protein|uniref:Gp138 family membrane-puncturing spike protein n=1 Tax=unclassified Methylophaga TaxID=2629249 RepID=UPI00259CE211|nr:MULTISPECIES: Gp138 family membrane-puncturing spike protein [unclassified Methylophaga]|tara:strand:- start:9840 stop:10520 length:681 start_codon:yes stop_codon:yes gene_type:complete